MRRAVVLLVVAFILRSFARAETYTGGTLTLSWNNPPSPYCAHGDTISASATANYDPNLPEGTEWYWIDSAYTFSWSFSPDGTCTVSSNDNETSATGSFSDPDDPGGLKTVEVTADLTGQIGIDDGEGTTLEVVAGPVSLDAIVNVLVVKIDSVSALCWTRGDGYKHCKVMPDGSAQPPNGTLSVWIMWSADAREHLSLNPPATAHSPVAYDPGWNVTFGPYTSDGTPTVGFNGNIKAELVVGNAKVQKFKWFTVQRAPVEP